MRRDLGIVSSLSHQVVILEIGTNDLDRLRPEVVGSQIEELVRLLHDNFSVLIIGVCEVLPRVNAPFFRSLTIIFVGFWNPFLMSFVGVIGVSTTLRVTLICPTGFM